MVKKKVVDADILFNKLVQLSHRSWCQTPYYSGSGYNVNNIEDAMRMAAQQMSSQIAANVNAAMSTLVMELRMAVESAMRDEDGGMCGLCRVNPDEVMPVDYRPNPSI